MDAFEGDAQILGDHGAAGEGGDVLQHGIAAVAVAWGLDRGHLQGAANFVDHQRGEGLALHVLGDDQQGLAGLADLFEQGQQVLEVGNFLLVNQQVAVLQRGFHVLLIGDEIGRQVAAVELHALDHVESGVCALGFLDGDGAVLADLVHGFGN